MLAQSEFNGGQMTVLVQSDRLTVKMPDGRLFELKDPDEEGRRFFVLTDQAAVSFVRDDSGNVRSMKLRQGDTEFELVRADRENLPP